MDHYEVLGVARNAPASVVRAAYHALLREHHPDRAGAPGIAMTQRINEAGDVLLDPVRRARYDEEISGGAGRSLGSAPAPGSHAQPPGAGPTWAPGPPPGSAPPPPGAAAPGPPPFGAPTFGPGATPLSTPTFPQQWGDVPDFLSGRSAAAPRIGSLAGETPLQRWSGGLWLAMTVAGPLWTLVQHLRGHEAHPRLWVALWAVALPLSFFGGWSRIRHRRPSARYVFTWAGAVGVMVFSPHYVMWLVPWLLLYAVTVESRRLWRWGG